MSKVIKQILSTHLSGRCAKISKSSIIIVFACAISQCAGSCSYANLESIIDVGFDVCIKSYGRYKLFFPLKPMIFSLIMKQYYFFFCQFVLLSHGKHDS